MSIFEAIQYTSDDDIMESENRPLKMCIVQSEIKNERCNDEQRLELLRHIALASMLKKKE